jgi:hypothetical protein
LTFTAIWSCGGWILQLGSGQTQGSFQLGSLGENDFLVSTGTLNFLGTYQFTGADKATGTSTLTKTAGLATFAAIGATGDIFVETPDDRGSVSRKAGTWTMVAPVPIPAALPLFGAALAGLGIVGWRKRNAEQA